MIINNDKAVIFKNMHTITIVVINTTDTWHSYSILKKNPRYMLILVRHGERLHQFGAKLKGQESGEVAHRLRLWLK